MDNLIYFRDGRMVAESGNIKAYSMDNQLFVEKGPGHTLLCSDLDKEQYIWLINDRPFGNCLVIGVGTGYVAKYLLTLRKVKHVVVVEENQDLITVQSKINSFNSNRIKVVKTEILPYLYKSSSRFDYIFIDCYNAVNEDTLPVIADIANGARRLLSDRGIMTGWLDRDTEEVFVKPFYEIMGLN